MNIPIQNIYFLLSYAWDKLAEAERIDVDMETITDLPELFAQILLNASAILLKKGIEQNYIQHTEDIPGIKGKLLLSETLEKNLLRKQRTLCNFDELSVDILSNQILVSTLYNLLKIDSLNKTVKQNIVTILRRFPIISQIKLTPSIFNQVIIHRNNQFYGFILNVCQIIYNNTLPSEKSGLLKFIDFRRNKKKMATLFEAFVRNFYQREQQTYYVESRQLTWQFSGENLIHLPKMQTDIFLSNKDKHIIIDTKFYKQTLSQRYDTKKIHSHNLYQLFSYILNQRNSELPHTFTTTGILLYPTVNDEHDLEFLYQNHPIKIKTINLNTDTKTISQRLLAIIN